MKTAFVDLSGTLLDHRSGRPVPLMDSLVNRLVDADWRVVVVSRHSEARAREFLAKASITGVVEICSSAGSHKGAVIKEILGEVPSEIAVYLDDKPENLDSALQTSVRNLRTLGFVGSRKYAPDLSTFCRRKGIELVLSTMDAAETLEISLPLAPDCFNSLRGHSDEEICQAMAGLDHPAHPLAGSGLNDHRCLTTEFLSNREAQDYSPFWRNLGWISCHKCMWKLLVESVLRSIGTPAEEIPHGGEDVHAFSDAVRRVHGRDASSPNIAAGRLQGAFELLEDGIAAVGSDANHCRPANRPWDTDRVEKVRDLLVDVIGD